MLSTNRYPLINPHAYTSHIIRPCHNHHLLPASFSLFAFSSTATSRSYIHPVHLYINTYAQTTERHMQTSKSYDFFSLPLSLHFLAQQGWDTCASCVSGRGRITLGIDFERLRAVNDFGR